MRRSKSMWLLSLILVLLVWGGGCLTTLTQTFDYSTTGAARNAIYPLGAIAANTSIRAKVTLWFSNTDLNNAQIRLLDGVTLAVIYSVNCPATTVCDLNYYTSVSKSYKLQILATFPTFVRSKIYNLLVETYPGTATYVGNPAEQVVLKLMDVLRIGVMTRYIYIEKKKTIFFTVFPQSPPVINPSQIFLLSAISSTFVVNFFAPIALTRISYVNKLQTFSVTLNPGFYVLRVIHTAQPVLQVSWQTDSYACPNNPDFVDYYGFFMGCTRSNSQEGFPCTAFNRIIQTCTACISGYILENGTCFANTTCPDRQYFHFGSCYNVSETCGKFDPFTGACLTCDDPSNFDLVDVACIHKEINCTDREWELNYTCYNVSDLCATFDSDTGKCLTCTNPLFQVAPDGSCIPIVVKCSEGQYVVGLTCVTIPFECVSFDKTRRICLGCIQGYFIEGGVCKRIICPYGQAPSRFGLFCIDVSPLCDTYDPINGYCLTCKQPNHRVNPDGRCVQFNSPLAGCSERQRLGFGKCENAENNCKSYNLITFNCDDCETGFYLDYTGHCIKSPACSASQWSVNGECMGIPENCLTVNFLGLCTLCVNSNYRLQHGQCIYFKSCSSNQYLNALGECVDVNSSCGLFNPSNGQCVTCKNGDSYPNAGVCCPPGQIYNHIACVDVAILQRPIQAVNSSDCLRFHPSLGYCLSCSQGYTPDSITQTGCAPI